MKSCNFASRFGIAALLFVLFAAVSSFAAPCALNPTNPSVTICTPAPNANVTSPVSIVAGSTNSAGVIAMAIYVDNQLVRKVNGTEISASATLGAGNHFLVAQSWDNAGRVIKQSENFTVTTAAPPPTITFSANPNTIASGQSSTLTWSTSNATSVSINNGVGSQPTSGSVSVAPSATTTYTLTATGSGGTSMATATVTVSSGTPPTISFSANPTTINSGQASTLTWSTTNATSVTIDNGIGTKPTSGSVSVSPTATTTYTLTATGPGGNSTAKAMITVSNPTGCAAAKPAPSVTICSPANSSTVPSPVHVLATPASNTGVIAVAVYFDNILKYKANVSKVDTFVDAAQGPHYIVVQFWDNNGAVPAKAAVNITVGASGTPAPTVSFSASPTSITSGASSTLTWTTTNANTVSIDHGVGTVSASGAVTVSPTATTTYTITATGSGGTTSAQATVTVSGSTPPPTATFSANPTTITAGQSSTLTWSTTNATSVSIDNGIGTKPTSGSVSVSPTATTTYTLTATGSGGSTTSKTTVTVGSSGGTCSAASGAPSVTICSPTNGSTVPSPVHVLATPASNNGVAAMAVYFDNTLKYKANVSKVDTLIDTTVGAHYIVVQFWDKNGNVPAKASVNITVGNTPPPPSGLTVSPAVGTVYPSGTQQFTAANNNGNVNVNWFVDDVQGGSSQIGTIDSNGVYTAPSAVGAHTIKAVSTVDSTVSGTAVINVVDPDLAMTTYHYDGQRTGTNTSEAILKPSNLNGRFGKLASYGVDGQVYAQPLYVPNLTINGSAHNVIFVATEHDSVYAFDADGKTSGALWQKSLLGPGQSPVANTDALGIKPEIGITSTPVIDRAKNLMYVVTYVSTSGGSQFWIHALDLVSGSEQLGGPKRVTATVDGTGSDNVNGKITLESGCYQRSGLALGNGQVYLAFAHCNHGWVLAYDQNSLDLTAAYNTTPDGTGGTIWMGGGAPAFDNNGNVYVLTGTNFGSTANSGYNNAFMKFSPSLTLDDYFMPSNNATLVANDVDLGAGAPLILPDNSSSHPHEIVGAGKDGRIFLVDRDNLGHFDPNADHVIQSIQSGTQQWNNFHDTPAYWNGNLYYHGNADVLRQFKWSNGLLSTSPAATGGIVFGAHGATPVVSANGTSDGIVWELKLDGQPTNPAILYAYDANNVANQLYNSGNNANDAAPPAVKFTSPTVVNGKVYVGGGSQVAIYGLVK